MARILVVDDEPSVRRILGRILRKTEHECVFAGNAIEAEEAMSSGSFDLVLSDINMPGSEGSGMHLAEKLASKLADAPLVIITGVDDPTNAQRLLELGAYGYLIKPFEANEILIQVQSALRRRELELLHRRSGEDEIVVGADADDEAPSEEDGSAAGERDVALLQLAISAEFRDNPAAVCHSERVGRFAGLIAKGLDWPEARVAQLERAAMLHDVGMIGVPEALLFKPGKLSDGERALVQDHASAGKQQLAGSDSALLGLAAEIAFSHHERYDGSGYPRGLQGEAIPLAGRITAIADVFDALTRSRVYAAAISVEAAADYLKQHRGKLFDAALVDLFCQAMPAILEIRSAMADGE